MRPLVKPVEIAPMEAPVIVVGDVHLTPSRPDVTTAFHRFLEGLPGRCAHLVLLGDIFEAWVSRRQARDPAVRATLDRLVALAAAGVRLAFQGGNRDFAFDGAPGLTLDVWPDVVKTRWGGRTVLLTHGDLLCSADARYQRMRRLLRSSPVGALRRTLPYAATAWVAQGLRGLSEREVARKPYRAMGIDYALARRWLETAGADLLVAGHVHTGVHHRLAGGAHEVLVLKDWDAGGGVVHFDGETVSLRSPADVLGSAAPSP